MSNDTSYDREGQFFPIFFVTISALVVVPVTYSALKKRKELENTASRIKTDYRIKQAHLIDDQLRRQKKRERKLKRATVAVCGWIFIALNIYWIATIQRTAVKIWDPYEILDISMGATERQIQSRYRKLSITLHPDKARPDPLKNETEHSINERWVEIIKAYKSLTDEDTRRNLELYGNPDGKQSTTFGIALPQFLIAEGNGKYVMIVYGVLLGIVLPYFVGSWWYGSQKVTRDGTLVTSVGKLFKEYRDRLDRHGILNAFSVADEHLETFRRSGTGLNHATVEERVTAQGTTTKLASGMTSRDKTQLLELDDGPRRQALALLWAYMGRIELDDTVLEDEKFEIATTSLALNNPFVAIAKQFGWAVPLLAAYQVTQNLIQAMPPDAPPLLQLPHFTRETIAKLEGSTNSSQQRHMTVQEFMSIPAKRRREVALAAGISNPHYDMAISVASQLPRLVVEHVFFKVVGEKYIVPDALVQYVVKARFIPPGCVDVPPVDPADLEDDDDEEERVNSAKRAKAKAERGHHQPPLAHAPYFARNHTPRWHLFITWLPDLQVPNQHPSQLQYKLGVSPRTYQTFNKPIVTAEGKPTFAMQTLKVEFPAPGNPGKIRFQSHLVCDSYVGFDDHRLALLEIEDPVEVESDDDISDPGEDTLAGRLAALSHDHDDDSGSDEDDDEEDTSDTDTDTSEEE